MIFFYIVHHQLSEAIMLQAYLSTTDFTNNVLVVEEAALFNITSDQPSAIICSIPSLTNGILKWLRKMHNPPLLICCGSSAEIENMVNTQQVYAYLQTPISLERVLSLKKNINDYVFQHLRFDKDEKKDFIFVKSEYKLIKISLPEILFLSGLKDYTQVFLKGKKNPLTTLKNLKEFETKLSPNDFIRVHRSYIVAIGQIDFINKSEITIDTHIIPIGNAFRKGLDDVISKNS